LKHLFDDHKRLNCKKKKEKETNVTVEHQLLLLVMNDRLEPMTFRLWQTDWLSRASAPLCPNASLKSPSSERR